LCVDSVENINILTALIRCYYTKTYVLSQVYLYMIVIIHMLMNHDMLVIALPLKIVAQRKYRQMRQ
jgi:hypothetical protein